MALALWGALPSGVQWSHAALLLLVVAPTLEEIVFRAGLQEALLRRLGDSRAVTANSLTATLFAATHVALRPTFVSLLTLLPALAIGVIYQRHRRIVPCIAVHIVFNGIWLQWVGRPVSA